MGDVSTHCEDAVCISPLFDTPNYRAADDTAGGRELGLTNSGDGDGGGGLGGCGDICLPLPEHSRTVHYDQTHYGSVSGREADTWGAGVPLVVGTGDIGPGRDT